MNKFMRIMSIYYTMQTLTLSKRLKMYFLVQDLKAGTK